MRRKDRKPLSAAEEYRRLCAETDQAARQNGAHLAWLHELREERYWPASSSPPPPNPQEPKKFESDSTEPASNAACVNILSYNAFVEESDRVAASQVAACSHMKWLHFVRERALRGRWGSENPSSAGE